jgi:hypothetical protein
MNLLIYKSAQNVSNNHFPSSIMGRYYPQTTKQILTQPPLPRSKNTQIKAELKHQTPEAPK